MYWHRVVYTHVYTCVFFMYMTLYLARIYNTLVSLMRHPFPLQLMSALKTGEVSNIRMASIVQQRQRVTVDRSGGGL